MNITIENYLQTMYYLFEKDTNKGIKSIDIAKELKISRPSVSSMVKKLAKEGYLIADKYSKIFLTEFGKKEARKLMHKHRVIEVFLVDVLGHNVDNVHEEAHELEHAFSDESIEKLDGLLNNPRLSPMGKSIPHDKDGVEVMNMTLDKLQKGQTGRIIKVSGKGSLHKRILDMGVVKGTLVKVEKVAPLGDPIEIKVKGYSLSLRKDEARNIEVALE
ncbi:MAG: DtxR family transcriptional regulator [Nanoarchaeota archaeon]|nr:DtxR family transcriptional regulator [Nanoarchaeota archaeon]